MVEGARLQRRQAWATVAVLVFGCLFAVYNFDMSPVSASVGSISSTRLSFVLAVATLIGAIIGSNQQLSRAATPWRTIARAGIITAAVVIFIQIGSGLARSDAFVTSPFLVFGSIVTAIVPSILSMVICGLARVPEWRDSQRLTGIYRILLERAIDGFCVGAALLLGAAIVPELPLLLLGAVGAMPGYLIAYAILGTLMPYAIIGFLIGFFVVAGVRRAAHAQIIGTDQLSRIKNG